MAARSGIFWFGGPALYAQRFSVAAESLEGKAEEVVAEVVERAQDRMREIINSGGINKTIKGGPRRLSDQMYNSVGGEQVKTNGRGRVQGEFGFTDNAPFWTLFQEDGTRARANNAGISKMLAYATALEEADVFFQDKIESTTWLPGVR